MGIVRAVALAVDVAAGKNACSPGEPWFPPAIAWLGSFFPPNLVINSDESKQRKHASTTSHIEEVKLCGAV